MNIKIRDYIEFDKVELMGLWWNSWHSSSGFNHPRPVTEWESRFEALRKKSRTLVAYSSDVLVGFMMINVRDKQLSQIFILPSQQGKGIGKILFRYAMQAMPNGFTLLVLEHSLGPRKFYESFGMKAGERVFNDFNGRFEVRYSFPPNSMYESIPSKEEIA